MKNLFVRDGEHSVRFGEPVEKSVISSLSGGVDLSEARSALCPEIPTRTTNEITKRDKEIKEKATKEVLSFGGRPRGLPKRE